MLQTASEVVEAMQHADGLVVVQQEHAVDPLHVLGPEEELGGELEAPEGVAVRNGRLALAVRLALELGAEAPRGHDQEAVETEGRHHHVVDVLQLQHAGADAVVAQEDAEPHEGHVREGDQEQVAVHARSQ